MLSASLEEGKNLMVVLKDETASIRSSDDIVKCAGLSESGRYRWGSA